MQLLHYGVRCSARYSHVHTLWRALQLEGVFTNSLGRPYLECQAQGGGNGDGLQLLEEPRGQDRRRLVINDSPPPQCEQLHHPRGAVAVAGFRAKQPLGVAARIERESKV